MFTPGVAAKVVNWVWLQFFVLGFMREATTPARIGVGVVLFDISQACFGALCRAMFKHSEIERVGTNRASFDRYHLQNLASFAFACCKSSGPVHLLHLRASILPKKSNVPCGAIQ